MDIIQNNLRLNLFWFHRDLYLQDNHGFYHSLKVGLIICCYIWAEKILNLTNNGNSRIRLIHQSLVELKQQITQLGSDLIILYGKTHEQILSILRIYSIQKVYTNGEYKPITLRRKELVANMLHSQGIEFRAFKHRLILTKKKY